MRSKANQFCVRMNWKYYVGAPFYVTLHALVSTDQHSSAMKILCICGSEVSSLPCLLT